MWPPCGASSAAPEWIQTVRRVGLRLGDTTLSAAAASGGGGDPTGRGNYAQRPMTRRLVLSYLGLALLILVVLEIPLAVLAARHEQDLIGRPGGGPKPAAWPRWPARTSNTGALADLTAILAQYQSRTGQEVAIIDPAGKILAAAGTDKDNDAVGSARNLVQAALAGRSVTSFSSDEGQPWASAAVPISADGQALGAVLLGVAAASTERRIHTIWTGPGRICGRGPGPDRAGRPAPGPVPVRGRSPDWKASSPGWARGT